MQKMFYCRGFLQDQAQELFSEALKNKIDGKLYSSDLAIYLKKEQVGV